MLSVLSGRIGLPYPPVDPSARRRKAGATGSNTTRLAVLLLCLLATGCASVLRTPLPGEMLEQATVLGRNDLRFWGDALSTDNLLLSQLTDEQELKQHFGGIMHREHNYLAISGGGADGAYGAGVLVGWSELGTRPEFTMVTGVSTGALTAPFAFLGREYDDELQLLYTSLNTSSILFRRSIWSIIRGDAVADNKPLLDMLRKYINKDMIARIAAEHRKGRGLYIGTSNLDAGRAVIWNIGRIADSGHPDAGDLIRQVLLASTSIPGVFPPAYIRVQGTDGKYYDEMHVDGGTSAQMFLYPYAVDWAAVAKKLHVTGTPTAYVIRNSRTRVDYQPVQARLPFIAGRSISSLIRTQGIGDAYRIAALTGRDGVGMEMTWVPQDAPRDPMKEVFDPKYMSQLFEFGRQRTLAGDTWTNIDIHKLVPLRH